MMSRLLIYREDLKVSLIKQNGDWVPPTLIPDDQVELNRKVQELLGFAVVTNEKRHNDILLVRRVFGDVKDNVRWANLEEAADAFEKTSTEVKAWIEEDIAFSAKKQLGLIKDVFSAFSKEGLEIYLCGGWAIDFLVGKVLRPHVDIDTLVWKRDKERVARVMRQLGYLVEDKERKFQNSLDGFQFDNDFIEKLNGGFISGRSLTNEGIKWPKETFEKSVTAKLEDVAVKVINPKPLYKFLKLDYYLKHSESSGPVGKTKQDLAELKKYLER